MQMCRADKRKLLAKLETREDAIERLESQLHVRKLQNGELWIIPSRRAELPLLKTLESRGERGGAQFTLPMVRLAVSTAMDVDSFQKMGSVWRKAALQLFGVRLERVPSESWLGSLWGSLRFINWGMVAYQLMFKQPGEMQLHHDGSKINEEMLLSFGLTTKVDNVTSAQYMVRAAGGPGCPLSLSVMPRMNVCACSSTCARRDEQTDQK